MTTKNGTLKWTSRGRTKEKRIVVKEIYKTPRGKIVGSFFIRCNKHYVTTNDGETWAYI